MDERLKATLQALANLRDSVDEMDDVTYYGGCNRAWERIDVAMAAANALLAMDDVQEWLR